MKFGLLYANVGPFAEPEPFTELVQSAEATGMDSIWVVEHVALPIGFQSRYPYTPDGSLPLPPTTAISDPLVALAYAAGITHHLRLAVGMLLIAQRHPLHVAKEMASLDRLSRGRAIMGVGIGWLREEYELFGGAFGARAARAEEAIRGVRSVWRYPPKPFEGEFFRWPAVDSHPLPTRPEGVPVVIGGAVDASARRAARIGDGFFPITEDLRALERLLGVLRAECARVGRDPAEVEVTTLASGTSASELRDYENLGVDRLVIAPPLDVSRLRPELEKFMEGARATQTGAGSTPPHLRARGA